MKTTLHARHLQLDQRLKARIERKLQRLDRVAEPPAHATVELTAKASRAADAAHVAEITLVTNGATLRSTSSAATPMAAVDAVIDKLERQVVRAKERIRTARRVPAPLTRGEPGGGPTTTSEEAAIVEITRLDMVPMFPEDAIARMDELGQAFFVFLNAQTQRVSVVYRRAGGGHGLIDPIVAR
ncbi:MAG: ribosome hibernation-promoting factor, HPF/YfiA family [Candidatus Limnocylindria bacterium]